VVDFPPFAQQQDVDPSISISFPRRGNLLDPHSEKGLRVSGRLPPVPSTIDPQYRAASAFARLEAFPQNPYGVPFPGRRSDFFVRTSCSISLSRLRAATGFFRLAFSSFSYMSRFLSLGSIPPYLLFQR